MSLRVRAFMVSARGHVEERKQEMPDVHQPDLSGAGEQEGKPGVPPLPPNASGITHATLEDSRRSTDIASKMFAVSKPATECNSHQIT